MNSFKLLLSCLIITTLHAELWYENQLKNKPMLGVFTRQDPKLDGLIWGNWGSRPYEYYWAQSLVSIAGKRVIDLGVGLPSQYNWYAYAVKNLKPSFYAGVDHDGRILNEQIFEKNYEMRQMDMSKLEYPSKSFDVAFCISTFEHIPYQTFMKSIQEAHRVLMDDGLLIITLDEEWDSKQPTNHGNGWNTLELSLLEQGLFKRTTRSFGLPEFLNLIKDYFVLVEEDALVDMSQGIIRSHKRVKPYYNRTDRNPHILNSGEAVNSCVSYAVLKKR